MVLWVTIKLSGKCAAVCNLADCSLYCQTAQIDFHEPWVHEAPGRYVEKYGTRRCTPAF